MKDMWEQFRKMPVWGQALVGGVVILVVLGGIGAAIGAVSGSDKSNDSATTTTSTSGASDDKLSGTTTTQPSKPAPKGDPAVDKNTRFYLNQMNTCDVAVGLVVIDLRSEQTTVIELARDTTLARDVCERVRDKLGLADTDHFESEAGLGFHAIDRYKSGLNALLAHIDNPNPTKLIEARDKLQEGDRSARQAEREINQRRRLFGLQRHRPQVAS